MDCPHCHQPTYCEPDGTKCVLCGFDLQPVQRRVTQFYLISFAIFVSTVLYAGLVYYFEQQGKLPKPQAVPDFVLYLLLVLGIGQVLLSGTLFRNRLKSVTTVAGLQRVYIVFLGCAEALALYGMLAYFLTHSLPWFTGFLALSWIAFLWAGSNLPLVIQRLGELAVLEAKNASSPADEADVSSENPT
jgi:hypothetical protein